MLLKYLNDLDYAVHQARLHPGPEQYSRCLECAAVLDDYLEEQVEPLRRRGKELMASLLPGYLLDDMQATVPRRRMPAELSELTRAV